MQKSIFDFRKGTFYRVFFMIFCLKNSTNVYFEVQTLLKRAFVPVQTSAVQKKHWTRHNRMIAHSISIRQRISSTYNFIHQFLRPWLKIFVLNSSLSRLSMIYALDMLICALSQNYPIKKLFLANWTKYFRF